MRTYFLADLHFDRNNKALCAGIFQALATIKADEQKSALYLLGDVFEYWLGFEDDESLLYQLADLGIPVYFQQGNRDFLLSKALLEPFGIELLPERYVLLLHDKRILLEHGDLLCTADKGYQQMRKIVRQPVVQWIYHALPKCCKQSIAAKLRNQSSGIKAWVDVDEEEVMRVLDDHQANMMIHGHTHKPHIHSYGNDTKRFVLGDFRANQDGHYQGMAVVYDSEKRDFYTIMMGYSQGK
ncbi:MAG: UDP-2,3-diacylglucosamine diphosphatase [Cardiobacteriaceae bacterium]|nr:UDP-2,3-diacylglucosamine diphosphatase [Cardiobacteriaceae bacterium]